MMIELGNLQDDHIPLSHSEYESNFVDEELVADTIKFSRCRCCSRQLTCRRLCFFLQHEWMYWGTLLLLCIVSASILISQKVCWTARDEFDLFLRTHRPGMPIVPLVHAHSHNDYEQSQPLELALQAGFCSIEADVYEKSDDLFTGHLLPSSNRLYQQYLLPLVEKTRNGSALYEASLRLGVCDSAILLIDMKTSWKSTWDVLERLLAEANQVAGYNVFQCYNKQGKIQVHNRLSKNSPIRVMVSGVGASDIPDMASHMISKSTWCSLIDDRWTDENDLNPNPDIEMVRGMISSKWHDEQFADLHEMVLKAHSKGAVVRFWGTPDTIEFWQYLLDNEVDLISTDRIAGLRSFLH